MALANYFSKNLLALNQVLSGGGHAEFLETLDKVVIGIAFDEAVNTSEGWASLDMTVRLVSRLYPKLNIMSLSAAANERVSEFSSLASAINANIEIVDSTPTAAIVVGRTNLPNEKVKGPKFYVGSEGWVAKFSSKSAVGSGNSPVPFGAGASACIGVSNVFRHVFKAYLKQVNLDDDFTLSLLEFDSISNSSPDIQDSIEMGDVVLVGFGAIGNGVLWSLSNCPFLQGSIKLIEPESLELGNLQRYILALESDQNKPKINIARRYLKSKPFKLVRAESCDWANSQSKLKSSNHPLVLIAVDNIRDRILIQSSLPKSVINSYTERNLIGISRHMNFVEDACLVCTYMPSESSKSHSQIVAENLGLPGLEEKIRTYLHYDLPADDQLLQWISDANSIELNELLRFKGIPISDFYGKIVCGGELIQMRTSTGVIEKIEAPLAFQSALAGIFLAAEAVAHKAGYRKAELSTVTQFHPLFPIKQDINPRTFTFPKNEFGRCICGDPDFIQTYEKKWKG